jgi:uncharacterized protein (DUF1800 family)
MAENGVYPFAAAVEGIPMSVAQKHRRFFPVFSAKAFLAALLSTALCLPFGLEVPLASAEPVPAAKEKRPKPDPVLKGLPIAELTEDQAILHALNRLAFGPRSGDVEHIKQIGLKTWIEQQLHPDSIDDHAMEARLADFPTLKMSSAQLIAEYPRPKQVLKREQRVQSQQAPQNPGANAAAVIANDMRADRSANAQARNTSASQANSQDASSEAPATDANAPSPMKQPSATDDSDVPPAAQRRARQNGFPPALGPDSHRPQRVIAELSMAKIIRAMYSERQLQQVMDDFWFNHFNVYAAKGADVWLLTSYERDVIQPHTLGKFQDLLEATAKSPAMLFYLDNFLSVDPNAAQRIAEERAMRQRMRYYRFGIPFPPPPPPPQNKKQQEVRGINENYGRELMELHTLGVDGGYTQKDVIQVARCFTGWSIDRPQKEAKFIFRDPMHDPGVKVVLGKKIHSGGMKDGEDVLKLLAHDPHTAHFISKELARRFVSDDPPPALVDRMAQTFLSSDGDIREVMRTMIYSPEFWSKDAYRAKIKSPFELVVSTARALGADVDNPLPLVMWTSRIGEPLYMCQPPTGYSDTAATWVNTGALLNRMNYSLALATNHLRGSHDDVESLLGLQAASDPKVALDHAVQVFLDGQAAPSTVETLNKELDNPQILQARLDDPVKQVNLGIIAGLVLGAPEFQRR